MGFNGKSLRALGIGLGLALAAPAAQAQVMALAADRPGTTFNSIGTGVAKVGGARSGMNIIVRPYAGPAAWMPLLNKGEVQLGAVSANSAYQAFNGEGEVPEPLRDFRILRSGQGSLMLGFVVAAKSDIRKLSDLKGKRISSDFGGHLSIANSLAAALQIGGLSWSDVTPVPVVGANDGIDALVADRLDASWASLGQPQVREADVKIGVRYLPLENTPEALAILREKVFPGAQIGIARKGAAPGVEADTPLLSYDAYLVAHKDLAPETVEKLLAALWEGTDELTPIHRSLAGFSHEASVTDAFVAPYHPAAIAFYKAKGLWTPAHEERQQKLMAAASAKN